MTAMDDLIRKVGITNGGSSVPRKKKTKKQKTRAAMRDEELKRKENEAFDRWWNEGVEEMRPTGPQGWDSIGKTPKHHYLPFSEDPKYDDIFNPK